MNLSLEGFLPGRISYQAAEWRCDSLPVEPEMKIIHFNVMKLYCLNVLLLIVM